VNSEINKLTIPLLSREHENLSWQKSLEIPTLILKAQSIENNTATICRVRFHDDASAGFDNLYDAHYLAGFPQPPAFYSKTTCDERLSTNTLPFSEETTVQLHFAKGLSGAYQIDAEGLNSFSEGTKILLRDILLNVTTDLTVQPFYYFTSLPGDDPERFIIHFSNHTGLIETPISNNTLIFYHDGKIIIHNSEPVYRQNAAIELFDIAGRRILYRKLDASINEIILPNLAKGIYIARVLLISQGQLISTKIGIY
jgi:hypothetical protein